MIAITASTAVADPFNDFVDALVEEAERAEKDKPEKPATKAEIKALPEAKEIQRRFQVVDRYKREAIGNLGAAYVSALENLRVEKAEELEAAALRSLDAEILRARSNMQSNRAGRFVYPTSPNDPALPGVALAEWNAFQSNLEQEFLRLDDILHESYTKLLREFESEENAQGTRIATGAIKALESTRGLVPGGARPITPTLDAQEPPRDDLAKLREGVTFGGSVYTFVVAEAIPWQQALAASKQAGGHLAAIETEEEYAFLKSRVGNVAMWLGGHYSRGQSIWRWVTTAPVELSHWEPGQPDGQQPHYMMTSTSNPGLWRDEPNMSREAAGYLLEKPARPTVATDTPPAPEPAGGKDIPADADVFQGHHYKVIPLNMSRLDAEAFCRRRGGYLAAISSQSENDFIAYLGKGRSLWIGAESGNGAWTWSNGEAFSYTNWDNGQPVGATTAVMGPNGKWQGLPAADAFICEWEK